MENKMTKRDFYNDIMAMAEEAGREDIVTFCENEIELLDKKAAKAKERQAAKKAEGDELTEIVKSALTDEYQLASDVMKALEGQIDEDTTISKVQYRLGALVKAGVAESTDIKVPGKDGTKASTRKGYRIAVEG